MNNSYFRKGALNSPIFGETIACSSHETEDGTVVIKPLSKEEEERLLKQSDLNKKIRGAKRAIRAHQKVCAAQKTNLSVPSTEEQELNDKLEKMDDDIRKIAFRRIAIENQVGNLVTRISKLDNDWKIEDKIYIPENFSDDINIKLKNSEGKKSVIAFSNSGEVKIICDFDDNDGSRSALQRLVVSALRDSGAKSATGKCQEDDDTGYATIQAGIIHDDYIDDGNSQIQTQNKSHTSAFRTATKE